MPRYKLVLEDIVKYYFVEINLAIRTKKEFFAVEDFNVEGFIRTWPALRIRILIKPHVIFIPSNIAEAE